MCGFRVDDLLIREIIIVNDHKRDPHEKLISQDV